MTEAVRRRAELVATSLAEFGLAGRVAVFVRLHVDHGAGALLPRVAPMLGRLRPPEGADRRRRPTDGAQVVSDHDAVRRAEAHDRVGALLQVADLRLVEQAYLGGGRR